MIWGLQVRKVFLLFNIEIGLCCSYRWLKNVVVKKVTILFCLSLSSTFLQEHPLIGTLAASEQGKWWETTNIGKWCTSLNQISSAEVICIHSQVWWPWGLGKCDLFPEQHSIYIYQWTQSTTSLQFFINCSQFLWLLYVKHCTACFISEQSPKGVTLYR